MRIQRTASPLPQPSFTSAKSASSHSLPEILLFTDLDSARSHPLVTDSVSGLSYFDTPTTLQRNWDFPRLETPREREVILLAGNFLQESTHRLKGRGKTHTVLEAWRQETIVKKLAEAFYQIHLKSVSVRAWRDGLRLTKFVQRTESAVLAIAIRTLKKHTLKLANHHKADSYRLLRIFNLFKSERIAGITVRRRAGRIQRQIMLQWSLLSKHSKAFKFLVRKRFWDWKRAIESLKVMKKVISAWGNLAKTEKKVKTQKKVRRNALAGQMRDERSEKMKRKILGALQIIVKNAEDRRKKIRNRARIYEKKLLSQVFTAWKMVGNRDFSRLFLLRKAFFGLRRVAAVYGIGRIIEARNRSKLGKTVIAELRTLLSARLLTFVKSAELFNINRLKSVYFQYLQTAVKRGQLQLLKAEKLNEKRLLAAGFQAFVGVNIRKAIINEFTIEQEKKQYYLKRKIFHALKTFTAESGENEYINFVKWQQRKLILVLFHWRKRTIESQMEEEQTVCNFRIMKLAKLAFQGISMLTWHKRIIRFRRKQLKRLLQVKRYLGMENSGEKCEIRNTVQAEKSH